MWSEVIGAAVRSLRVELAWARVFSCAAFQGRESLARRFSRLQSAGRARTARPRDRRRGVPSRPPRAAPSPRVEAPGPLAVRGTPAELNALVGQRLVDVRRRGKFLLLELETRPDRRSTRCSPAASSSRRPARSCRRRRHSSSASGDGPDRRRSAARWTRGADWLPADDAAVEIRYRDPTQMGKVYLLPAGVTRSVPGLTRRRLGPDADDPALTLDVWRQRIRKHPGELKNLLKNQEFVAGIGNAYSDEILHAARLLPFRKRSIARARGGRRAVRRDRHVAHGRDRHRCESASRRRSRSRSATSSPSTTRAARLARVAARGSAR